MEIIYEFGKAECKNRPIWAEFSWVLSYSLK